MTSASISVAALREVVWEQQIADVCLVPRADAVDAPVARGRSALPRVRWMRRPRSAVWCTTESPGPGRRRISQQRQ
jgi:hypothetical protein